MKDALKYGFYIALIALVASGAMGVRYVINVIYDYRHVSDQVTQLNQKIDEKLEKLSTQSVTQVVKDLDVKNASTELESKLIIDRLDEVLANAKGIPRPTVHVAQPKSTDDNQPQGEVADDSGATDTVTTLDTLDGMWDYYCQASSSRGHGSSECATRGSRQGAVQTRTAAKSGGDQGQNRQRNGPHPR